MSEATPNEATSTEAEKPVQVNDDVKFPPFPDPTDDDFEEDISEEERNYYKEKFPDINAIKDHKLHCTACDRHLGCSARNEARMRSHPMLRTLVCHTCHSFYNSGEFDKGDDGSELYCRWCGQGGQVYCCSDCCHVFCAKCIKRNLGTPKIKEIENTDDWKCFKCMPRCLWDMRAVCWALLRYCDLKNKITYTTQDPQLKEAYQKDCALDLTECCKNKIKRKDKADAKKKDAENSKRSSRETENSIKKTAVSTISKIPPTIQVKKFASINLDDSPKEKKAQKRSLSPKNIPMLKNPITVAPAAKLLNPTVFPSVTKKMRMTAPNIINPMRFQKERNPTVTYGRIRPKIQQLPMLLNNQFNGYNSAIYHNIPASDNINLSLESLTQGLDMSAVAHMAANTQHDDLLCTPDFPLEPLCEVTEDNTDDDVQCITPGPIAGPKVNSQPPPLVSRVGLGTNFNDQTSDNIIQMTENDVTVNAATGGLKFRVDPQTLSSNKMYRLPDGRIFAINANPNMPGGYSATIVAVADNSLGQVTPKGPTYAAKLSAVSSPQVASPSQVSTPITKATQSRATRNSKRGTPKTQKSSKGKDSSRKCDLNVPIEWYRYNLIDAVDALEYSLTRLQKLRKEATTMYLRTRTLPEMRSLHKNLERLLNTSSTRFNEIKHQLNKEMKQYATKKMGSDKNNISDDDDDDDVEILNDLNVNDDPIFIDENSVDSVIHDTHTNDTQEVDLTGVGSSEHNESGSKSFDKDPLDDSDIHNVENGETYVKARDGDDDKDSIENVDSNTADNGETSSKVNVSSQNNVIDDAEEHNKNKTANGHENLEHSGEKATTDHDNKLENNEKEVKKTDENVDKLDDNLNDSNQEKETNKLDDNLNDSNEEKDTTNDDKIVKTEDEIQDSKVSESMMEESQVTDDKMEDIDMSDDKTQDAEMSEEMIKTLLEEDCAEDSGTKPNLSCLEIPDEIQETE